jgi:exosortase
MSRSTWRAARRGVNRASLPAIVKFTRRDLGWAVLLGALIAISPQSSSKTSVSLVCGVMVFGATLYYRATHPRPEGRVALWSRPPPLVWVVAATYLFLFSSVGFWLAEQYIHGIWWNGHSFFVPVLMAVLTDRILRKDADKKGRKDHSGKQAAPFDVASEDASPWGLPIVALGLAMLIIDCALRSQYLSLFGLLICLPGFSLLLLGVRRTRLLRLPLLLSLFMIPVSTRFAADLYLPQLISRGVVEVVELMGIATVRVGTSVSIAEGGFNVSDDCSGFGGVYASWCVALVLGTYCRSRGRIALLIAMPWLLAIAINIPRGVVLLLGVKYLGMPFLATFWHTASGIVAFWIALLLLIGLADRRTLREELG